MKRRFVSILCAATMVASLMTGATVVSAADKDVKDISIGVSFGQNVHPFFVKGVIIVVSVLADTRGKAK